MSTITFILALYLLTLWLWYIPFSRSATVIHDVANNPENTCRTLLYFVVGIITFRCGRVLFIQSNISGLLRCHQGMRNIAPVSVTNVWKKWVISTSIPQQFMMTSSSGTMSALLAICERNPTVTDGFPSQKPVTRSFDVSFDLRLNKRLNIQSRCQWFETPSRSLWRHCNDTAKCEPCTGFMARRYCLQFHHNISQNVRTGLVSLIARFMGPIWGRQDPCWPHEFLLSGMRCCNVGVILSIPVDLCDVFPHILQGCFTGTGSIVWLPQCQWSNPEEYGHNLTEYNHNGIQQSVNHVCLYTGVCCPGDEVIDN